VKEACSCMPTTQMHYKANPPFFGQSQTRSCLSSLLYNTSLLQKWGEPHKEFPEVNNRVDMAKWCKSRSWSCESYLKARIDK